MQYSEDPIPAISVGLAEAVAGWETCPSGVASLQMGLGAGFSPLFPPMGLSAGMCRRFRVPLDYSQGIEGGSITVTVKRARAAGKEDGQLWLMQGGPGSPSHPLLYGIQVPGKVSYTLDHRGTGWSTVLDCPKVRNQPGTLPWGTTWMKWVGLGNVSVETVDACLMEISKDIGAPKHFTAANAARDLASIIMAIQAETNSTADVGIHGFSYGTVWARRFLELQGREFPIIVSHVGIDGVCSGDYDFGQYALAANRAGQRLMDEYCDADCRIKLGAPETGSVSVWFGEAVREIDKAIADGSAGFCGTYLWERFVKASALSGWTAKASAKEALGVLGYLGVTRGLQGMQEYVTLVLTLRRCVRDAAAKTIPPDFWQVASSIESGALRAALYLQAKPPDFSAILHHIVSFGDMWKGPPELQAWGSGEVPRDGSFCRLDSWRRFFDERVFWAPDFVTLMNRYEHVFKKHGYRESAALVHSNGHAASNVTVLVTNGDLDGQTPLRSARATFDALPTCKAKVELPAGRHCVSSDYCLREVVKAFYSSPVSCSDSLTPDKSSDLGQALERFNSGSCNRNNVKWFQGLEDVDICGLEHHSFTCRKSSAEESGPFGFAGGSGLCDKCFARCVQLLGRANVQNPRCICAAEAARCGARGNCAEAGVAFCAKEASDAGCDDEWCTKTFGKSSLIAI